MATPWQASARVQVSAAYSLKRTKGRSEGNGDARRHVPHDAPEIDAAFAWSQPLGSSCENHCLRRGRFLRRSIAEMHEGQP
jgi:hypothetical protein